LLPVIKLGIFSTVF